MGIIDLSICPGPPDIQYFSIVVNLGAYSIKSHEGKFIGSELYFHDLLVGKIINASFSTSEEYNSLISYKDPYGIPQAIHLLPERAKIVKEAFGL